MRLNPLILALPSLALAEQHPLDYISDKLKVWYEGGQSILNNAIPSASSKASAASSAAFSAASSARTANPIKTATEKLVDAAVTNLTMSNWKGVLTPSARTKAGQPDEWQIFLTGGNKTCYGMCGPSNQAWKGAVPLLKATPRGPHLGQVDCEVESVLCAAWGISVPAMYTVLLPNPQPDQTRPHTPIYSTPLNRSSVRVQDIVNLHTKGEYKKRPEYEGYFHPFDGFLHQSGLIIPVAYLLWGLSKMPTWLPMIAISLGTRWFSNRRLAGQQGRPAAAGAPGAAPARAPAPAR